MRRPFIAGNWKMNLLAGPAAALAGELARRAPEQDHVDLAVCPPSIYLQTVAEALAGSPIGLGAQNMHHEDQGAFTGEISGSMLCDVGCTYVILGHSERRHVFGENDAQINQKVHKALSLGLIPIVCLGETLEQREADRTVDVVRSQFAGSLADVTANAMARVVLAYEPVWAIGTGKVATPQQAEQVHADLRTVIDSRYNASIAEQVRIQYGGSVKPENAADLLSQPNIDGALVGGASLKADAFLGIVGALGPTA